MAKRVRLSSYSPARHPWCPVVRTIPDWLPIVFVHFVADVLDAAEDWKDYLRCDQTRKNPLTVCVQTRTTVHNFSVQRRLFLTLERTTAMTTPPNALQVDLLLVGDEKVFRSMTARNFRKRGYQAHEAHSGIAALN